METVAGSFPGLAPRFQKAEANGSLVRHLLGLLPENLQPDETANQLVVALVWGDDHLIDLREVIPGKKLSIGTNDGADLQVFHDVTRLGPLPIVETSSGRTMLFFPAGATARIDLGGRELTTIDMLEGNLGRHVTTPVDGVWMELGLRERAIIQFGHVRLIARFLKPAAARKVSPYGRWFWARIAIYLLTAFSVWKMLIPHEP
jgi:hypothetical protein